MAKQEALEIFEIIDTDELAGKLKVKPCWIRNHSQHDKDDPIPCLRLGRYVRFQWGHPTLAQWLERRRKAR